MKVLIDADRYPYSLGNATDEDGDPLSWNLVTARLDDTIQRIVDSTRATDHQLVITSDDRSNFRYSCATIKPYKGNRTSPKYFWYTDIRRYLVSRWKAVVVTNMEADDALGIEQYQSVYGNMPYNYSPDSTIISSVDKDLNNIPGWHYDELKEKLYFVKEEDALRNFYCQLLTGDVVDNVPGLYGVGKSSSLLGNIRLEDSECGMFRLVKEQYEKRFGSYWKQFMIENGTLLWILRSNNTNEFKERFDALSSELDNQEENKEV